MFRFILPAFFRGRRKKQALGPPAPPIVDQSYAAAIERARYSLQSLMRATGQPGLSVAVGLNDRIIWSEGFGYADLQSQRPVDRLTQFRIASVSKIITGTTLARLWQAGLIDLDEPVAGLLPEWPRDGDRITLRLLAGHLAGIRHYLPEDFRKGIDLIHYPSATEALAIFKNDPLVAPPGQQYSYTSFGFTLLSAALEKKLGKDFPSIVEEIITHPLELSQTVPNSTSYPLENLSTLYGSDKRKGWKVLKNMQPSYKWAGGGYVSTAEELVRFGLAHWKPGFLNPAAWQQLFTPQQTTSGALIGVGLGWVISKDPWERTFFFHDGSQSGARSLLTIFPEEKLAIALLSNVQQTPDAISQTGFSLADLFLSPPPASSQPTTISPSGNFRVMLQEQEGAEIQFHRKGRQIEGRWMNTSGDSSGETWPIQHLQNYSGRWRGMVITPKGIFPISLQENSGEWLGNIWLPGHSKGQSFQLVPIA